MIGRIGRLELALFCLPMIVVQGIELPWKALVPSFFSQTLGQPLAVTALLLSALRLFDIIAELAIGWTSDRARFAWGRRKPWIALSVLPVVAGAYGVFLARPGIALLLLLPACLLLRLGYAMFTVTHHAWAFELASDHHDRTRVIGARIWSSSLATPVILLIPVLVETLYGASRAGQMAALGLLVVIATPILAAAVLRFVRERPQDRLGALPGRGSAAKSFELPVALVIVFALAALSDAAITAMFLFFVEDALGLRGWGVLLLLLPPMLTVIALPIWAKLSMAVGKPRALAIVLFWQLATAPAALFLPAHGLLLLVLFLVVRCLCWGADFMLIRSMIADICARASKEPGRPPSGVYNGVLGATQKLAASVGIAGALGLLAYGGYEPGRSGGDSTLLRLVFVMPTCLYAALALLILKFRPGAIPAGGGGSGSAGAASGPSAGLRGGKES